MNRILPALGLGVLLIIGVLGLLLPSCGGGPDKDVSRKLQEAQAAFLDAESPAHYLRVAALYQDVLDRDFVNGAVLFNQGNAFMRAGQKGRAVAAYRQASRYRARDEYLKSNLELVLGSTSGRTSRGLVDYVFFWQEWLSFPEKIHAATAACALTLLAGLLSLFRKAKGLRRALGWFLLFVSLLFVTSAAIDWYRHDVIRHGAIVVPESTAHKGNSDSFAPAFSEPLTEGAEFILIEKRGEWLHLELEAGTGWIRSDQAVVY